MNVIIGALIIKEIFQLTDEEIVETLPFDIRYQYALHTTSSEEQPLNAVLWEDFVPDAMYMKNAPGSI